MRRICFLLSTFCLMISCSSLPPVYPVGGATTPQIRQMCRDHFTSGKWQFLHAIEATMPGGHKGFMMGVTIVSPADQSIRCVIMTIEGLVVFDAAYNRQIDVKRAISPFDSKGFAEGLIKDIQLIFFKPAGPLLMSGVMKNGSPVCRYQGADGRIVDVVTHADQSWEIRQFNREFHLERTAKSMPAQPAGLVDQPGIATRIELTARNSQRYSLVMDLVEAVALNK